MEYRAIPAQRAQKGQWHSHRGGEGGADVGKVNLKSNGDEALSDEFLLKSSGDEALNDLFL